MGSTEPKWRCAGDFMIAHGPPTRKIIRMRFEKSEVGKHIRTT